MLPEIKSSFIHSFIYSSDLYKSHKPEPSQLDSTWQSAINTHVVYTVSIGNTTIQNSEKKYLTKNIVKCEKK